MRALALCCLLLAAAGCISVSDSGPPPQPELSADDLALAEALGHYSKGLLTEAVEGRRSPNVLEEFTEAARLDPESRRLLARVAASALYSGDADVSIDALKNLCSLNPTSVTVRIDLAAVYLYSSQPELAEDAYREAVELEPDRALTYWEAARSFFGAEQDELALEFLSVGLAAAGEPNILLAYLNAISVQFVRARQVARAIPCLTLLTSHMEERAEVLNLLAEAYAVAGRSEEAEAALMRASRLPSATVGSFVRLAMMQIKESAEPAIETLLRGRDVYPEDRRILFMLAYSYTRLERLEEAIEAYAALHEVAGKDDEGPLSIDFYMLYANSCDLSGKREQAEGIVTECLAHYPEEARALNFLAYTWAENGVRLDDAEEYVGKALETEPDNGAFVDTLGWVYYQKKQFAKALKELARANTLMPGDSTVIEHLGDAHAALGEEAKALAHWTRSFLIDPEQAAVREKLESRGVDVELLLREQRKSTDVSGTEEQE